MSFIHTGPCFYERLGQKKSHNNFHNIFERWEQTEITLLFQRHEVKLTEVTACWPAGLGWGGNSTLSLWPLCAVSPQLTARWARGLCGSANLRSGGDGLEPWHGPKLPAWHGLGQMLRLRAYGSFYNMNKTSPRSLPAFTSVVLCWVWNPASGKSREQRMSVWSVEMLRQGG